MKTLRAESEIIILGISHVKYGTTYQPLKQIATECGQIIYLVQHFEDNHSFLGYIALEDFKAIMSDCEEWNEKTGIDGYLLN